MINRYRYVAQWQTISSHQRPVLLRLAITAVTHGHVYGPMVEYRPNDLTLIMLLLL